MVFLSPLMQLLGVGFKTNHRYCLPRPFRFIVHARLPSLSKRRTEMVLHKEDEMFLKIVTIVLIVFFVLHLGSIIALHCTDFLHPCQEQCVRTPWGVRT
jgi:hypothetical protein